MEFSPNGRFLAVGDQDTSSLYILDRLAGFYSLTPSVTPATPTALVWETGKTFYVGLSDGRFIHYRIDLGGRRLVRGIMNVFHHGALPVTAIGLDVESKTLVLSLGPAIYAFRRTSTISKSDFPTNWSSKLILLKVIFDLPSTFQAASISKENLEKKLLRSLGLFASPQTTRLSSPSVVRI